MRILLLSRYADRGASSRVRYLQYLPHLRAAGFEVRVAPFFDNDYLDALYAGRRPPLRRLVVFYARRLGRLLTADADLLWIEKEALPWLPEAVEARLRRRAYVVDYDDAWFHRYDRHPNPWVRRLLGDKIDRVMRGAALVVAGNRYLADRATAAGAPWVEIVPTVVDPARYDPRPRACDGRFTVSWIGTPQTAAYLPAVAGALAEAVGEGGVVRLIGAGAAALPGVPVEALAWSEASEAAELAACDVGVMPLPDAPFERGKCGYKLIQYMAAGRPVVASPVGVNRDLVEHGVNGFLAESENEWCRALVRLRDDPALRQAMGAAGRRLVEDRYSLAVIAPRMVDLLRRAGGQGKGTDRAST